jgi:hypothetical protein
VGVGAIPAADVPEVGFDDVVAPLGIADDDLHGVSRRAALHEHELLLLVRLDVLLLLGAVAPSLLVLAPRPLAAV